MYVLVNLIRDWGDEFDTYGFKVFKKEDWDTLVVELQNLPEGVHLQHDFGTNEFHEWDSVSDLLDDLHVNEITEAEAITIIKVFKREFRGGFAGCYGVFPDLKYMIRQN